jgi:catechol 2,3-dioxygenase-like lactoylglutathione lyase family enzyme
MLDHVSLKTADFAKARAFYEKALAPLGYKVLMEFDQAIGMGGKDFPDFWVGGGERTRRAHVAFVADDRKAVDAFHAAALEAGGRDNGAPGLRPHYHAQYYGAFVLDLDDNNIEAVCHRPE